MLPVAVRVLGTNKTAENGAVTNRAQPGTWAQTANRVRLYLSLGGIVS